MTFVAISNLLRVRNKLFSLGVLHKGVSQYGFQHCPGIIFGNANWAKTRGYFLPVVKEFKDSLYDMIVING